MAKLLDNVTSIPAKEAAQKATLPEPTIETSVDLERSVVRVVTEFPLDYDGSLAYMSKKTKIVGETQAPVPITFEVDGEQHVLAQDGNVFAFSARLGIRQQDKKPAETAETKEGEGTSETEEDDKPEV